MSNSNTEIIIDLLESLTDFDNRYENLICLNYDRNTKEKQGVFSLIFSADDTVKGEKVVIKFFDPDWMNDAYRLQCFQREASILERLLTKTRCLQLKRSIGEYDLDIPIGNSQVISYKLNYFVTEHLPISILDTFYDNNKTGLVSTEKKLEIFRQIVLSVKALHDYEIYHRDLKPDNLRGYEKDLKTIVVAIDLGTAVHSKLKNINSNYLTSVGANGYASPESFVGLAGNRELDFYTDFYSLGCMLYELFHYDFLFNKIDQINNKRYFLVLNHCRMQVTTSRNRLETWKNLIEKHKHTIKYPDFNDRNLNIPPAIIRYLNKLLKSLIAFDYMDRNNDFEDLIKSIDTSLKIIRNESYQQYIIQRKKLYKENKEKKKIRIRDKFFHKKGKAHA